LKRPSRPQSTPNKTRQRPSRVGGITVSKPAKFKKISENTKSTVVRFKAKPKQFRMIALSLLSSLLALVLLVLATVFTPLLAVENIRVTGVSKVSKKAVEQAVKSQLGVPLPLVSSQAVAESLSKFSLIESFSLVSELPNTLHVAISERQPIAIVDIKGVSYLYDPAGVRVGEATFRDEFPRVASTGEPKDSKSFALAIDVLLALPASLLPRVSQIDAKSKDDVTMQLRGNSGQRIIWGDASQSTLKSKVLAALVENQKVTDRVTFDVSSPTAPVVRYR
jgi:cell division protein FtsQ